jgi:hypothetical protein
MAEPADDPRDESEDEREAFERLWTILGPRLDDVRALLDDVSSRWRGDALRVGEGTRRYLQELARDVGFVTRDEWEELELRIAQLEHRLRLIEDADG